MTKGVWHSREKTLENGKIVRWKERSIGDGEIEKVYEEDGQFRISDAQPVRLK